MLANEAELQALHAAEEGCAVDEQDILPSEPFLYNESMRVCMALVALPLSLLTLMLIAIAPIMFAFMHDDPKSYEYPGSLSALFAMGVYSSIALIAGLYSWLLWVSALQGVTRLQCGSYSWECSSQYCGYLLPIPGLVFVILFIVLT